MAEVDANLLVTFYSFLLAIIIFLASKFLDQNEKIREFLASNFQNLEGDDEVFEGIKDGLWGQVIILIPLIFSIGLSLYLLVNTVFGSWNDLGWKNYILILFVTISIIFIFGQALINNLVTLYAGYSGDPWKWWNMFKKKK